MDCMTLNLMANLCWRSPAIITMTSSARHAQQDVDLDKLFMDVAVYNTRIMGLAHVESVTHLACRTALSYRGVAHINFPTDIQDFTSTERSKRDVPGHTTSVMARGAGGAGGTGLQMAAAR